MDNNEIFSILKTCIVGEAYQACGVGFNHEDSLDVYHLVEINENVDPDDIKGPYQSPDAFLEMECQSNSDRIYETIYLMESSWKLGTPCFHKNWQLPIGKKLWDLGKSEAAQYLSTYGEEEDLRQFIDRGESLFG